MRVNMNIGMQNNFFNVRHINQGLNQNNFAIKNSEQQERKDTVSISSLGKASSLIESLIKQKQNITEMKNELIGTTLEKGGNMDSIKSQLECFEKQLKNIDEQIAQTMAEQSKRQAESQKEIAYKKPKTEEEIQTERLNSIVSLSSSLSQAQVVSSAKTKVDGESRILEMEIKLDESRGGASASKKERLADLQKQSANLTTQINKDLIEASEEIKDSNDNQLVKPENFETIKNSGLNTETKHKTESSITDNVGDKVNDTDSDEK
ncbi:hypothetical protein KQI88_02655 [Alkaliphilus sp. MSJ-5]|uniref:FlxA-like protein n=1 Tax=Alkaliphilus flagellatus TaxID=2841507 RepID=A0ABS6FZ24_9FIRM|nr:hypothetical protein [Alkaliphilus flagellatus]MBU5675314.1 hypothetical protein [Alkaliphilus flagellatus]